MSPESRQSRPDPAFVQNAGDKASLRACTLQILVLGAMDWIGIPEPHARQDIDASLVTPADGKPEETKKALLRRCFKPRPPYEIRGGPVLISGCRSALTTLGLLSLEIVKPARSHRHVRMWANAEIGIYAPARKRKFRIVRRFFSMRCALGKLTNPHDASRRSPERPVCLISIVFSLWPASESAGRALAAGNRNVAGVLRWSAGRSV
jgi:hypothetical protein